MFLDQPLASEADVNMGLKFCHRTCTREPLTDVESQLSTSMGSERGGDDVVFRMTSCKNRFQQASVFYDANTCFRNLALNLEVGWKFTPEGAVVLLPVSRWHDEQADRMICEVVPFCMRPVRKTS